MAQSEPLSTPQTLTPELLSSLRETLANPPRVTEIIQAEFSTLIHGHEKLCQGSKGLEALISQAQRIEAQYAETLQALGSAVEGGADSLEVPGNSRVIDVASRTLESYANLRQQIEERLEVLISEHPEIAKQAVEAALGPEGKDQAHAVFLQSLLEKIPTNTAHMQQLQPALGGEIGLAKNTIVVTPEVLEQLRDLGVEGSADSPLGFADLKIVAELSIDSSDASGDAEAVTEHPITEETVPDEQRGGPAVPPDSATVEFPPPVSGGQDEGTSVSTSPLETAEGRLLLEALTSREKREELSFLLADGRKEHLGLRRVLLSCVLALKGDADRRGDGFKAEGVLIDAAAGDAKAFGGFIDSYRSMRMEDGDTSSTEDIAMSIIVQAVRANSSYASTMHALMNQGTSGPINYVEDVVIHCALTTGVRDEVKANSAGLNLLVQAATESSKTLTQLIELHKACSGHGSEISGKKADIIEYVLRTVWRDRSAPSRADLSADLQRAFERITAD